MSQGRIIEILFPLLLVNNQVWVRKRLLCNEYKCFGKTPETLHEVQGLSAEMIVRREIGRFIKMFVRRFLKAGQVEQCTQRRW
jgi:hypothetical protein